MSTFHVQPQALTAYAAMIDGEIPDLAGATEKKPATYASSYINVPSGSTLFDYVADATTKVSQHLQDTYPVVSARLAGSATSLRQSAKVYHKTDTEEAARHDALMHTAAGVVVEQGPSRPSLIDPADLLLSTPSDATDVPDMVSTVLSASGWASISNDVLAIAQLLGFDPAGKLTDHLFGDVGKIAQAGHACTTLAQFNREVADDLQLGVTTLSQHWGGHAYSQAEAWFLKACNALYGQADQLDDAADKFAGIAQACSSFATIIGNLLSDLIDQLVICAGALASAGCLQEIPAVDVVLDIIGGYEVWVTYSKWYKFGDTLGNVINGGYGFAGLVEGLRGIVSGDQITSTMPKKPYGGI